MTRPSAAERLLPWGALLAGLVLFVPGLLFGGEVPFSRDAAALYEPLWRYVGERFRHGELPLWFPYEGLGAPVIENTVSGIFHPFSTLLFVFPAAQAMRIEALLCLSIAFLSTWSLARRLGAAPWAAILAAESYAFSGTMLGLLLNSVYLRGAAFYPLLLLGLHLTFTRRLRGIVLAALSWGLLLLAGEIQTAYMGGFIGAAFLLALRPPQLSRLRALGPMALAAVLGTALAAVQVIPTLASFQNTVRGAGLNITAASRMSFNPWRLLDLFLGDGVHWTMGDVELNVVREYVMKADAFWCPTVFVGALVLVGVLFALTTATTESRRGIRILAATSAILLWLAMGPQGGLYLVARKLVPRWSAFRFPEKLVLYAVLLLVLLAAIGWTRASQLENRAAFVRSSRWILIGLGGICLLIAIGAFASPGSPYAIYFRRLLGTSVASTVVAALCVFAIAGGSIADQLSPRFRTATVPVLALILLFVVNGWVTEAALGPDWSPTMPSPAADALQQKEPALGHYRVLAAFSTEGRLASPDGAPLSPAVARSLWQRAMLQVDHNATYGIETPARVLPAIPTRSHLLESQLNDPALIPLFNTRYLVTTKKDLSAFASLPHHTALELPDFDATVVDLDTALPRAFFAQPLPAANAEEAMGKLLTEDVRTGRKAVVEGIEATSGTQGTVQITSYTPERVELRTRATGPGFVVLNDTYDDGWQVEVDGASRPMLHANVLVRAVQVPPGEHTVVFRYPLPKTVKAGAGVSLATLVLLIALGLWSRKRGVEAAV